MLLTLEEVKQYLRLDIDESEEDTFLMALIENAEIYIEDGSKPIATMSAKSLKKAKLLARILISDWYENREYTNINAKMSEKVRYTVNSLMLQLKLRSETE